MKLSKEGRMIQLTFTDNVFIHTTNDWYQFSFWRKNYPKFNWYEYDFALLQVRCEKDEMFSGWEFEVKLLGVGLRLRINTTPNERTQETLKAIEEIENGTADLLPIEELTKK